MEISLPSIGEQHRLIIEMATEEAIGTLRENLQAPTISKPLSINEANYSRAHLLREREGWESPDPDIVKAYFDQFQLAFPSYATEMELATVLGLMGQGRTRRIREFKSGERKVPYTLWRRFLVMTGRAPQEIIRVMGFLG